MHSDLTRDTFDPKRHYSSVRHQQGRVQLDADFNEQADIGLHLERTANADVVGRVGAPYADPGDSLHFKVEGASPGTLEVAPGRIYVDGILVENEAPAPLADQPHLPAGAPVVRLADDSLVPLADAPTGQYVALLEVADRHLTAIQEPALREVALGPGGPDTTTRVQTVWQVYLYETPGDLNCLSAQDMLPQPGRGRLTSDVQDPAPATDPCEPGGTGGYRGLENQLYRVEIHGGGPLGTATFKWSRENGSVVVAVDDLVEEPLGVHTKVLVSTLGRDDVLGLAETQWVELVDDHTVQLGQTGTLAQIVDITPAVGGGYVVELSQDVGAHLPPGPDPTVWHPFLRRWDQTEGLEADGTILTGAGPIELERGVEVSFSVDAAGTGPDFRPGDYWILAARTSTGTVEILDAAPPRGARHYAVLALLDWDDAAGTLTVDDCRPIFPPATGLIHLLYVGGDGQQGQAGVELPTPLQVSVTRGRYPVPDAHVHFAVVLGSGQIAPQVPPLQVDGDATAFTVRTGADGVAGCLWTLGGEDVERVEARLLLPDGSDAPNPPLRFSATPALGVATDPGVIIKGIFWNEVVGGAPVPAVNDHTVPMRRFLTGLDVPCDNPIEPPAIDRPTCFVTIDLPFPVQHPVWGAGLAGYERIILDATADAAANVIRWRPNPFTRQWLTTVVQPFMREHEMRLLAHLTLKGNFIRQEGAPLIYLDGEALGTPDGAAPHNLRLRGGDGHSGGDFEMWFWIEPDEQIPPPPGGGGFVWDMVGIDNILFLDPVRVDDTYDRAIIDLLYAGLVRLDDKLEILPDLAESWEFEGDGQAITFFLRPGLTFSDGSPLTAHDVKFSFERAMDPANGSAGPIYLAAIHSIDVLNDTTVRLSRDGLFPRYFLAQLTTPPAKIVSMAAVQDNPEDWDKDPITSGAFRVPQWARGTDTLVLEPHPGYWQPAPLDQLVLHVTPDHNEAWNRYQAGDTQVVSSLQTDVTWGVPPEIGAELKDPITAPFSLRYVGFHHVEGGVLSDPRVRLALAFALKRDEIVRALFRDDVQAATRFAPPGLVDAIGFECDLGELPTFDIAAAEALLEDARWVREADGFRNHDTGQLLAFDLAFAAEGNNEQVVVLMAEQWAEFGVPVNLVGFGDVRAFSAHLHNLIGNPDLTQAYYSLWLAAYADPQNVLSQQFHTIQGPHHMNNNATYSSQPFDELVDVADPGTDPAQWVPAYCKAESIVMQELPWLPLLNPQPRALIQQGVQGLVLTGQGIVIPDFGALAGP